jgi:hypothetical protein
MLYCIRSGSDTNLIPYHKDLVLVMRKTTLRQSSLLMLKSWSLIVALISQIRVLFYLTDGADAHDPTQIRSDGIRSK